MITTCCPCDFFTTATLSSLRLNCFMVVDFTVCIQRMKYRTHRLAYIAPHRLDNVLDCGPERGYVRHNSTLVHYATEWAILRVVCGPVCTRWNVGLDRVCCGLLSRPRPALCTTSCPLDSLTPHCALGSTLTRNLGSTLNCYLLCSAVNSNQSIDQSINLYLAIKQRRVLQCGYSESKRNVLRRVLNVLTDGMSHNFRPSANATVALDICRL